jgi:N-acetylmuramoyl-L-alanine amidase
MTLRLQTKQLVIQVCSEARRLFHAYPVFIILILSGLMLCCVLGVAILQEQERQLTQVIHDVPLPKIVPVPSINFDERPEWAYIDTAIIHLLPDKNFLELRSRLTSTRSLYSVHYTIAPDGTLYEHVREDKRAWHTKRGALPDRRKRVNSFSVGIGILMPPAPGSTFPMKQLQTLRALLQQLDKKYTLKYISVHSQVSLEVRTDFADREFPSQLFPEYANRWLGSPSTESPTDAKQKDVP